MPQDDKTTMEWYAEYGFVNGKGNCYVMAAMFCEMAKTLGYDAHLISGKVPLWNGGWGPHSWVEVIIDGVVYVCDPDFTNETGSNGYYVSDVTVVAARPSEESSVSESNVMPEQDKTNDAVASTARVLTACVNFIKNLTFYCSLNVC